MGGCCVPPASLDCPSVPPCRFTDFDLMRRPNTAVLQRSETDLLLKQYLEAAVLRYVQSIGRVLEHAPLEEWNLAQKLQVEGDVAVGYFKYCFRSGTAGGSVGFDDIKVAEKQLISRMSELAAAAEFLNKRKSYDHCTNIASDLMKRYQTGRQSPVKSLSLYRTQAIGPFADLCGTNLQELICEFECGGEAGMLALRQKQLRRELRLVHGYRSDALTKCSPSDIQSLTPDPLSVSSSFLFSCTPSHKAGMSIIEVIERIPSVDSSDMGREASVGKGGALGLPRSSSSENVVCDVSSYRENDGGLGEFGDAQKTIFVMKHISENSDSEELKGESSDSEDVRKTAAM